ncbi:MAG: hypothetical protein IJW13_02695 [Clostridia bacterium]|nr:hypothetical protein [Clostridia bacterium]
MKTKILSLLIALTVVVSSFAFIACSNKEEQANKEDYSRMTVDINPSVEFMLDGENKVVSVTALNDDGSLLIAGEAFVGKTAEEATELVVTLATETGYLVKGSAEVSENEVKISVAGGEQAAQLLASVKEKINTKLEQLDVEGKVAEVQAMGLEAMKEIVKKSGVYTAEEVDAMTEDQLYKAMALVRLETASLITEDLREVYYSAKESKITFAQSEQTAKVIEAMGGVYTLIYNGYKAAVDAYSSAITAVDNFRYEQLVSPDSQYQKALQALREAKAEVLKQRTFVASLDVNGEEFASASITLQGNEEAYDKALAAFEALGNTVNDNLVALIEALRSSEQALRSIESSFSGNIQETLQAKAQEIEDGINQAKDQFFANFEEAHKEDIKAIQAQLIAQKQALKEAIANSAK